MASSGAGSVSGLAVSQPSPALAREAGALSLLPEALDYRALYCVDAGELAGAAAARDEAEVIRQATGMEPGSGGDSGLLAALREEERAATGHIEQLRRDPGIGGVSRRAARLEHALAVLYNGLARYPEALAAAQRSGERHPGGGGMVQALAELVEAAVRCHQPEAAQTALEALRAHTRLGGTDGGWASRPARGPCWPTAAPPSSCIPKRSGDWAGPGCGCRWPAPTCSTGNGCAASAAAPTPAPSCAPHTTCSRRWAPSRSPAGPGRS